MVRLTHKINHGWAPNRNDPEWEERVEREAEATTAKAQKAYERAQARLERAEAKLAEARAQPAKRTTLRNLAAEVERRRQELIDLHNLMRQTSAPSTNRGRGSWRGVPDGRAL